MESSAHALALFIHEFHQLMLKELNLVIPLLMKREDDVELEFPGGWEKQAGWSRRCWGFAF